MDLIIEKTQVATPYFLYESCTAHLLRFARHQGVFTFGFMAYGLFHLDSASKCPLDIFTFREKVGIQPRKSWI